MRAWKWERERERGIAEIWRHISAFFSHFVCAWIRYASKAKKTCKSFHLKRLKSSSVEKRIIELIEVHIACMLLFLQTIAEWICQMTVTGEQITLNNRDNFVRWMCTALWCVDVSFFFFFIFFLLCRLFVCWFRFLNLHLIQANRSNMSHTHTNQQRLHSAHVSNDNHKCKPFSVALDDGTSRHSFTPQRYRCVYFITATVIFDECATQQTNKRVSVIIFALHLSSLLKCVRVWMWDLWWFIKLYRGRELPDWCVCVCKTMIHPISCHARFSKLWECHASFIRDTERCTHTQNAYVQIYVVRFWTYAVHIVCLFAAARVSILWIHC